MRHSNELWRCSYALFVCSFVLHRCCKILILNNEGIIEERVIKSGIRNWQVIEIIDGLSESDQVVLSIEREGVVAGAYAIAEEPAL